MSRRLSGAGNTSPRKKTAWEAISIVFRIIMPLRALCPWSCHMPFHKVIHPFTLTNLSDPLYRPSSLKFAAFGFNYIAVCRHLEIDFFGGRT